MCIGNCVCCNYIHWPEVWMLAQVKVTVLNDKFAVNTMFTVI
uniref:Uncharacterized protein n=1 Tax=Tetranychus urticae TaxID=32264 RepID=T1K3W4_TETUR